MITHGAQKRHSHHAQQAQSTSRTTVVPPTIVPHVFSERVLAAKHSTAGGRLHHSSHRYSKSTNSIPVVQVNSVAEDRSPTSRAAKLLPFMRRTLSYKRAQRETYARGMFSTPEEGFIPASRTASSSPSSSSEHVSSYQASFSSQAPTIEQIAMGLHTSRTPHLRAPTTQPRRLGSDPGSPRKVPKPSMLAKNGTASSSSSRLAQPLRSSLKKTSVTASAASSPRRSRSTSPSTSTTFSTPPTSQSALGRLSMSISTSASRTKVGRLLFSSRAVSGSRLSSQNSSVEEIETPRKSVRFQPIMEDDLVLQRGRAEANATVMVVATDALLPP